MRFTPDHHWLRADAGFVIVGITPFATEQLGRLVFVELPKMGDIVTKGEEVAVVESAKTVSDVTAPISGEIVAVNMALEGNPDLANDDPMGGGWLFRMSVADPSEIDGFMDEAGYQNLIG
jgi:glycine cleavage system H protein